MGHAIVTVRLGKNLIGSRQLMQGAEQLRHLLRLLAVR
jgi:hypothetical protein